MNGIRKHRAIAEQLAVLSHICATFYINSFPIDYSSETSMSIAVTSLKIESVFGKSPATRVLGLI